MRRYLTIEDLAQFCETKQLFSFNAKDYGGPIVVHDDNFGLFELYENNDEDIEIEDSLLHLKIRAAHTSRNVNGSNISKENMEKHMQSLKNKPVLAHIIPSPTDESVLDFDHHNMEFDDDGNVIYIESQVGHFTGDEITLEYDDKNDKYVVIGHAVIPENYTPTASILRRKGGTKVSCELEIYNLAYNVKENYLDLIDFQFTGVALLGEHIKCGMEGSRADITSIEDFSAKNNSMFNQNEVNQNVNEKLFDMLEKLNTTLSNFNNIKGDNIRQDDSILKNHADEGEKGETPLNKLDELLEKYNKTMEDITFETEGLSDEELETKFTEAFGEDSEIASDADSVLESETDGEDNGEGEGEAVKNSENEPETAPETEDPDNTTVIPVTQENSINESEIDSVKEPGSNVEKFTKTYELSHDDIRTAIYQLLLPYEENENDCFFVIEVFDDKFIYSSWLTGNYYGQKYTKDGDSVAFDGERYTLYAEYITESEKIALEEMRSNYSSIVEQLNAYKANELKEEKENILSDESYAEFMETDEFKTIVENIDKYSIEELKTACDLAFAKCVKTAGKFSLTKDTDNTSNEKKIQKNKVKIFTEETKDNTDPYGDYFKSIRK